MKKTFLSLAVITTALVGITSCGTKDYTCTCTGNQSVERYIIPDATKAQAETICKNGEVYVQGATNIQTCEVD